MTVGRRVALRLLPLVFLLYLINYIDRVNVSFAALRMKADLGLSDSAYGFGASLFFLTYVLFARTLGAKPKARHPIGHYLRENFYITTSGNFCTQTLTEVIMEMGADRTLYSVDYPFEDTAIAADWFDHASISEADRTKIGRTNAAQLFRI